MNSLDILIAFHDMVDVKLTKENNEYIMVFTFGWDEDYGCFKAMKSSNLTVIIPENLKDKTIRDLKENKGIIWEYIIKHREYVGELIDLKEEKYEKRK